jgi:stage IV sporulation protein FB
MFDSIFAWKFPIGRIFGITLNVHLAFVLVAFPLTLSFCIKKDAPPGTWIDACALLAVAFTSITLHEFGHCFGARSVGGQADEIMLWPLGGLAECSYLPATPWANFVFTVCGPLVNLVLCVISGLVLTFGFEESIRPAFNFLWVPFRNGAGAYALTLWNGNAYETTSLAVMAAAWTFFINWILLLFNTVLVGIPWDGGYMMRAILWPYVGHHRATMYMIFGGFVVACILFMGAFLWHDNPMFLPLSLYTFLMCYREWTILENRGEESLFGYDFSQGYTSLEKDEPRPAPPRKKQNFIQRYLHKRNARRAQREQEQQVEEERRMDELLEKIQREGKQSLTDEETRFLKRVSDRYRNRHQ